MISKPYIPVSRPTKTLLYLGTSSGCGGRGHSWLWGPGMVLAAKPNPAVIEFQKNLACSFDTLKEGTLLIQPGKSPWRLQLRR